MKAYPAWNTLRVLECYPEYDVIFSNHYEGISTCNFEKIIEIVIRPEQKTIFVRISTDACSLEEV